MEIGEEIIQYSYNSFKRDISTCKHHKDAYFQELIKKYPCFHDKLDHKFTKWNQKSNHIMSKHISKKQERPTIGNKDVSPENTSRKDFQTLLNKLTDSNLDTMIRKMRVQFNKDFLNIYIDLLYESFKKQPHFQSLYISILETIYQLLTDDDILNMNLICLSYIQHKRWILNEDLILHSENYDMFCEYLKQKKISIALAQAWGRLLGIGSINIDPYEWLLDIVNYCMHMDFTNKYHITSFDCYIEQMKEFYKVLPKHLQNNISMSYIHKIYYLQQLSLPKKGYFKLLELLELLEKNEIVFKFHHKRIEDGL